MHKRPNEVFTPRSAHINERMYVDRPEHETRLHTAIHGTQHVLIHGESGSGKSWLYKRVLAADGMTYEVVNLANASSFGSLREAFRDTVQRTGQAHKTSYTETKAGGLNLHVVSGGLSHQGCYTVGQMEPLEQCMQQLSQKAGNAPAIIVLDNLEAVRSDDTLMAELGNIIILLDDPRYASYSVKLLIVGVPANVREYYRNTPNRQTVANRLMEIPEITRLTYPQCRDLVVRGFRNELGYHVTDELVTAIAKHAAFVTHGVPQRLHEWCLGLAESAELTGRNLGPDLFEQADWEFLMAGLSDDYETILYLMNDPNTKIGRRNQVLYALGTIREEQFTTADVEGEVRKQFPKTTQDRTLSVSTLVSELSSAESPIIRRTPKGDAFAFSDPRYRMCIRAMLKRDTASEKVRALNLGSI